MGKAIMKRKMSAMRQQPMFIAAKSNDELNTVTDRLPKRQISCINLSEILRSLKQPIKEQMNKNTQEREALVRCKIMAI